MALKGMQGALTDYYFNPLATPCACRVAPRRARAALECGAAAGCQMGTGGAGAVALLSAAPLHKHFTEHKHVKEAAASLDMGAAL